MQNWLGVKRAGHEIQEEHFFDTLKVLLKNNKCYGKTCWKTVLNFWLSLYYAVRLFCFEYQVKCADGSADEIMKKAAVHKINLRKLDSNHVREVIILKSFLARKFVVWKCLKDLPNFKVRILPETMDLLHIFYSMEI